MNSNPTACPRYTDEDLAWEYDQRNQELSPAELAWYLKYARLADGPILELACGSGRLLIPLAQAGCQIDGADYAEAMLGRLRQKLKSIDIQRRPKLFAFDMVDFVIEPKYAMIFIGYNSLQYVETKEGVLRCFENVNAALMEGGYFLFMLQRLNLSPLQDGRKQELDWMDKPVVHPDGMAIGSKFVTYLHPSGGSLVKERTYRITHADGSCKTIECQTTSPILEVSEYREMLSHSGFVVNMFSGYSEEAENAGDKILCFVCRKGRWDAPA